MTTVQDWKEAAADVRRTKQTLESCEADLSATYYVWGSPRDCKTEAIHAKQKVALRAYQAAKKQQFKLEEAYASDLVPPHIMAGLLMTTDAERVRRFEAYYSVDAINAAWAAYDAWKVAADESAGNVRRTKKAYEATVAAFYAESRADGCLPREVPDELNAAIVAYKAAVAEKIRLEVSYASDPPGIEAG